MPGLYVHIPFCAKKCPYCDFASYDDILYLADDYIDCAARELQHYKNNFDIEFDTLFIGGGTPTMLTEKQLDHLFSRIYSIVERKKLKEITIEANPETVTGKNAKVIQANVNRVSLGCQSFHEKFLERLDRIHDVEAIHRAYGLLRANGIANINLDLMFGIEGQSAMDVLHNIEEIIQLKPEHVSFYMLTVYGHTELGKRAEAGLLELPHDEVLEHMYLRGAQALEKGGYKQYEISNFAMPGKKCLHNLNYWKPGEYIGIGSAASSYFKGKRFTNTEKPGEYIKRMKKSDDPVDVSETSTPEMEQKEYIMLRLRTTDGMDLGEFKRIFNYDFYGKYSNIIDKLTGQGMAVDEQGNFSLTRKGFLVSNEIIQKFF
jgi:oxygen-independent coproporphyrinogen-3 oxidase